MVTTSAVCDKNKGFVSFGLIAAFKLIKLVTEKCVPIQIIESVNSRAFRKRLVFTLSLYTYIYIYLCKSVFVCLSARATVLPVRICVDVN